MKNVFRCKCFFLENVNAKTVRLNNEHNAALGEITIMSQTQHSLPHTKQY